MNLLLADFSFWNELFLILINSFPSYDMHISLINFKTSLWNRCSRVSEFLNNDSLQWFLKKSFILSLSILVDNAWLNSSVEPSKEISAIALFFLNLNESISIWLIQDVIRSSKKLSQEQERRNFILNDNIAMPPSKDV